MFLETYEQLPVPSSTHASNDESTSNALLPLKWSPEAHNLHENDNLSNDSHHSSLAATLAGSETSPPLLSRSPSPPSSPAKFMHASDADPQLRHSPDQPWLTLPSPPQRMFDDVTMESGPASLFTHSRAKNAVRSNASPPRDAECRTEIRLTERQKEDLTDALGASTRFRWRGRPYSRRQQSVYWRGLAASAQAVGISWSCILIDR
jgi:hypothetical protein